MQPSSGPNITNKAPLPHVEKPRIPNDLKGLKPHGFITVGERATSSLAGKTQRIALNEGEGAPDFKKNSADEEIPPPPPGSPPPAPPGRRGLALRFTHEKEKDSASPKEPEMPLNFISKKTNPSPLGTQKKPPLGGYTQKRVVQRMDSGSPEFKPDSSGSPSPQKSPGIGDPSPASIIAGAKTPESPGVALDVIAATDNVLEALSLPDSSHQMVEESITFVKLHRETWKELGQDCILILENGVKIDYNVELDSVTLTIAGQEVDFDSLTLRQGSPLASRRLHEDHLFIIKNQVRLVKEARQKGAERKEKGKLPVPIQVIYVNTKTNIGSKETPAYLQRALMFTSDNQVILHLNKKAVAPKIGEGGFKKVSLAINIRTGEEFASASIHITGKTRAETRTNAYNVSQELTWGTDPAVKSHPDCLQINSYIVYDSGKSTPNGEPIKKTRILYKRLEGEELFEILRYKSKLNKAERIFIIKKLAEITHHFHQNGIALKDLKTENFFIGRDAEGKIKVTAFDFGLLQKFEEKTTQGGTLDYKAPEYRELSNNFTSTNPPPLSNEENELRTEQIDKAKGDVWALGMMLCEVVGEPWALSYLRPIFRANNEGKAEIAGLPAAPPENATPLERLVWRMLQVNPVDRPSMDEVVLTLESI